MTSLGATYLDVRSAEHTPSARHARLRWRSQCERTDRVQTPLSRAARGARSRRHRHLHRIKIDERGVHGSALEVDPKERSSHPGSHHLRTGKDIVAAQNHSHERGGDDPAVARPIEIFKMERPPARRPDTRHDHAAL